MTILSSLRPGGDLRESRHQSWLYSPGLRAQFLLPLSFWLNGFRHSSSHVLGISSSTLHHPGHVFTHLATVVFLSFYDHGRSYDFKTCISPFTMREFRVIFTGFWRLARLPSSHDCLSLVRLAAPRRLSMLRVVLPWRFCFVHAAIEAVFRGIDF